MKTKFLLLFCISFIFHFEGYSQDQKKLKKAVTTFKDGQQEKGIKQVRKLLKKDNEVLYWDILVQMEQERYYTLKQQNSSLESALEQALQSVSDTLDGANFIVKITTPSDDAFQEFIQACLDGTRLSNSLYASQYLRNHLVDYLPDTSINEESKKAYMEAERAFGAEAFRRAIKYYTKAISKQPNYYKALLYLGDAYWYLEEVDSAIHFFEKAAELAPDLLEPQKYLADAFGDQGDYQTTTKKCWNGIYIYPDLSMFLKLEDALEKQGQSFDRHWITRPVPVNKFGSKQDEKIKNKAWNSYRQAKLLIEPYSNEDGIIIKENELTKSTYLEVFAWEKMLANDLSKNPELTFAKKMQAEGYLDCYVFLSLFQHGFYEQYKHFVKHNSTKIKTYIERYLME
jgi:tetratricopeptide (TPR) repeat protein